MLQTAGKEGQQARGENEAEKEGSVWELRRRWACMHDGHETQPVMYFRFRIALHGHYYMHVFVLFRPQ
jgi:hypothetical protein